MKRIIIGSILTAGILLASSAQAKYIDKNTKANLVEICEAIKSNSKIKLYIAIRESGIGTKAISGGLVCDGYEPVTFAILSGAEKTAKFMARKSGLDYEALLAK